MKSIKRKICFLATVLMVLFSAMSVAEEEITVIMGTGTRPSMKGNRVFEIDPVIVRDRGYTSFSWQDTADNGPYLVQYSSDRDPRFWAHALGSKENSTISEKVAVCKSLIPGNTYTIRITDRDGATASAKFTLPGAEPFRFGSLTADAIAVVCQCRSRTAGKLRELSFLNASQITEKAGSTEYGFFYQIQFKPIESPLDCRVQISILSPVGYMYIINDDHLTMPAFKKGTGKYTYDFLGQGMFTVLKDRFGSVPSGDYIITLYIDGMFVRSDTVTVL